MGASVATSLVRGPGVPERGADLPRPLASAPPASPVVRRALLSGISLVAVSALPWVEVGRMRLRVPLGVLRELSCRPVVLGRVVVTRLVVVVEGAAVGASPPTAAPMVVRAPLTPTTSAAPRGTAPPRRSLSWLSIRWALRALRGSGANPTVQVVGCVGEAVIRPQLALFWVSGRPGGPGVDERVDCHVVDPGSCVSQ